MAFLKTKHITAKHNDYCNARHCQNKKIYSGERVVWTLHTYRLKTISAAWHPECHKQATAFAPYWDKLLAIQENRAALPSEFYDPRTGKLLKRS